VFRVDFHRINAIETKVTVFALLVTNLINMKIRFAFPLFLLFFILSCQKKETTKKITRHDISGEWILDTVEMQPHMMEKYNFQFDKNGTCHFKDGFYLRVEPNRLDRQTYCSVFMGTKATYRIICDSLKIYDNNGNDWMKYRINEIKADELVLSGNSGYSGFHSVKFRFKRVQQTIPEKEKYDAIIVSRGPCFGSCPMNGTYIDCNGDYFFNGIAFNTQNEFFTSSGNSKVFQEFEDRFNHAQITKLKDNYFGGATDGATNEVTFIKNGKIFKTISDYWSTSPPAFYQAYEQLSYKYQSVKMDYVYDQKFDHNISFSRFTNQADNFLLSD
jgi:hypothetical protein